MGGAFLSNDMSPLPPVPLPAGATLPPALSTLPTGVTRSSSLRQASSPWGGGGGPSQRTLTTSGALYSSANTNNDLAPASAIASATVHAASYSYPHSMSLTPMNGTQQQVLLSHHNHAGTLSLVSKHSSLTGRWLVPHHSCLFFWILGPLRLFRRQPVIAASMVVTW
ncbi:unnamed protein product [Schistocephalus solidus]|uniref:Myocyte enhancer factor 2d n=1 Tax=Schistocephalus solidus TaxID=70667 RepID=A0A183SC97_SCHSO|nr:unnamed protein product [Schistocephalus solidus]